MSTDKNYVARLERELALLRACYGIDDAEDFVPLKRAAVGISTEALRQAALQGRIAARRDGSRWYVSRVSVEALLRQLGRWPHTATL